jgi:hypothetical protein
MVRWLVYAATLLPISAGFALLPHAHAQQARSPQPDTIDCRMLARMPNAPMTVQTATAKASKGPGTIAMQLQ